jgi:Uma2 family endonuclease
METRRHSQPRLKFVVEITSPSNSAGEIHEKIHADLSAGAQEVWIFGEDGNIEYHDRDGRKRSSSFNIKVSLPDVSKKAGVRVS